MRRLQKGGIFIQREEVGRESGGELGKGSLGELAGEGINIAGCASGGGRRVESSVRARVGLGLGWGVCSLFSKTHMCHGMVFWSVCLKFILVLVQTNVLLYLPC